MLEKALGHVSAPEIYVYVWLMYAQQRKMVFTSRPFLPPLIEVILTITKKFCYTMGLEMDLLYIVRDPPGNIVNFMIAYTDPIPRTTDDSMLPWINKKIQYIILMKYTVELFVIKNYEKILFSGKLNFFTLMAWEFSR